MFCRVLARDSRLLCLWTSAQGAAAAAGSTGSRKRVPVERIVLQVGGGVNNPDSKKIQSAFCSSFPTYLKSEIQNKRVFTKVNDAGELKHVNEYIVLVLFSFGFISVE